MKFRNPILCGLRNSLENTGDKIIEIYGENYILLSRLIREIEDRTEFGLSAYEGLCVAVEAYLDELGTPIPTINLDNICYFTKCGCGGTFVPSETAFSGELSFKCNNCGNSFQEVYDL